MGEHTPTPWRVEEGTDLIWGACNPDDQSSYGMGYSIVEGKAPGWKPYKPSMEEREANAAFIVEAVNNHARLTRENEEMRKALETFASFGATEDGKDIRDGLMRDRICDWFGPSDFDEARAALSSLKEGTANG